MSRAGKPVELLISKRSKPIKRKTPEGKQTKKPKTETKTRQVGESGGKKASVQLSAWKQTDKCEHCGRCVQTPHFETMHEHMLHDSCFKEWSKKLSSEQKLSRLNEDKKDIIITCEQCDKPAEIPHYVTIAQHTVHIACFSKWLDDHPEYKATDSDDDEKEDKEEKEEKEEEMSDDDPSDQDDEEKEQEQDDDEDEAKVEQQDHDNETKESKKCYAVTFKGQFNSDGNQFGIFKNECKQPIICSTWERAQRVKEETINKYLDKFYDKLVDGRDKIDFTDKIRPEYNAWARKTQFEIRYKYFPGACYCATFDTKDDAKDFAKLLNTVQKGEAIHNRFWIRRVCQSYLRLKMRITRGVVLA